jgi:prepilin-type N-terminal cleavage/methylation domain-containing protein
MNPAGATLKFAILTTELLAMEKSRLSLGFTLVEIMIAVAIVGAMAMIAAPSIGRWSANQRVKSAGQSLVAAFELAHGEAIRTGNLHIVFFQTDAQDDTLTDTDGTPVPILVINDGRPGDANQNCKIDAGEIISAVRAERDVAWGVGGATEKVPNDPGTGAIATGSSFTDPNNNAATWTMFRPEGLPISFSPTCALGGTGTGAGGVYVTNGQVDYAVVLSPLGSVRAHGWIGGGVGEWTN